MLYKVYGELQMYLKCDWQTDNFQLNKPWHDVALHWLHWLASVKNNGTWSSAEGFCSFKDVQMGCVPTKIHI